MANAINTPSIVKSLLVPCEIIPGGGGGGGGKGINLVKIKAILNCFGYQNQKMALLLLMHSINNKRDCGRQAF